MIEREARFASGHTVTMLSNRC